MGFEIVLMSRLSRTFPLTVIGVVSRGEAGLTIVSGCVGVWIGADVELGRDRLI